MDHSGPLEGKDGVLWAYADKATRLNHSFSPPVNYCADNSAIPKLAERHCGLLAPGYEFVTADGQWGWYDGHEGYDWVVPEGASDTVYAAADGVVECTGWGGDSLGCPLYSSNYGFMVVIQHPNGYKTLYGHLQDGSNNLSNGAPVSPQTPIGVVGNTSKGGTSTGTHLHFSVLLAGKYVDPFGWSEWGWNEPDPLETSKHGRTGPLLWADGLPHRPGQPVNSQSSVPPNQRYMGGARLPNEPVPVPTPVPSPPTGGPQDYPIPILSSPANGLVVEAGQTFISHGPIPAPVSYSLSMKQHPRW